MNIFDPENRDAILRDAFNRPIREVYVPSDSELRDLGDLVDTEQIHRTELLALKNQRETEEIHETLEGCERLERATRIALEALMEDLTGESEIPESDVGYSLSACIRLLEKHAFVQCSELTAANIEACLENGGTAFAYCSDSLWRGFFDETPAPGPEISGMRAVLIRGMNSEGFVCTDCAVFPQAVTRVIDARTIEWLGRGSWMLEVYK